MPSILTSAILAIGGLAIATASAGAQPVRMDVDNQGDRIVVTVIGVSPTEMNAHYSLNISSGAGGNRSTHAGNVHLVPGKQLTMSTITVSVRQDQPWAATLEVLPSEGAAYSITKTSD